MKIIVFDLETKKTFEEVGGKRFDQLGVTVLGLYDAAKESYEVLEEAQLGSLTNRFIDADLIIGYNIKHFDYPVLQPYVSCDLARLPTLDLLEEIEKTIGHRVGLDNVAKATLGRGKIGSGMDAIYYWRDGKIDLLKKYCLEDVRLTKELYDYGVERGEIFCTSRDGGQKVVIKTPWKGRGAQTVSPPANYSLF